MTDSSLSDERVRISVIQRLMPSFAFTGVALAGGIAALCVIAAMNALKDVQSGAGGIGGIASALSYASTSISVGLILGGLLDFAAIAAFIGMLFPSRKTANPPGIYLFVLAIISLIPIMLAWPIWWEMIVGPFRRVDIRPELPFYYLLQYGALLVAAANVAACLAFSFVPLKAKPGKKFGALAIMIIYLFIVVVAKAYMSYQLYQITLMGR